MIDYYHVLDVARYSDIAVVKSAYKKLAIKYHPDKNPGNTYSDEKFKEINEAYQNLKDPYKKQAYDNRLQHHYNPPPQSYSQPTGSNRRDTRPRNYKYRPRPKPQTYYKVDKTYLYSILLSILFVGAITVVVVIVTSINSYYENKDKIELAQEIDRHISKIDSAFNIKDYALGLTIMNEMTSKFRRNHQVEVAKSHFIEKLNSNAQSDYQRGDYHNAAKEFKLIIENDDKTDLNNWLKLAESYYSIGKYKEAINAYNYILIYDEYNISIILKVAGIYEHDLENNDEARKAYHDAKLVFKKIQTNVYGEAFELVMKPKDTPETFYTLFMKRGLFHLRNQNYEEAISDFNWAITIRPNNAEPYYQRGMAFYHVNKKHMACSNWEKAMNIGHTKAKQFYSKNCN